MSDDRQRLKLRAPADDRGVLIQPPLDDVGLCLQQNRFILEQWDFDFGGQSARKLRLEARDHLLTEARRYTAEYRDVDLQAEALPTSTIVLTGHQPELFHAGVWFKNFVLNQIARDRPAIPIHLIIDNDVPRTASIRVPAGSVAEPLTQTIPIDQHAALPFEELAIRDASLYQSFDARVLGATQDLLPDPLLLPHWQHAISADHAETHLGYRLARFRHRLEANMGLQTLELPLSVVCDHATFRCVVANLLSRCEQVHNVYNESLVAHRHLHRVRSEAHPVPNLSRREDWYEMPFWIWTETDPERRALFARQRQGQIEITGHTSEGPWVLGSCDAAITNGLSAIRTNGVKIRPRALVTTLFARLFLCDLFLHGIGGAKYDELTDVLIERLFQVKPPGFFVATSTLRLPIAHATLSPARISELKQQLRGLRFHAEVYLAAASRADVQVSSWIAQKQRWIEQDLPRGQRQQRHDGIEAANRALRNFVQAKVRDVESELQGTIIDLRRQAILDSREYSFCLFPHNCIQDAMFDCLPSGA